METPQTTGNSQHVCPSRQHGSLMARPRWPRAQGVAKVQQKKGPKPAPRLRVYAKAQRHEEKHRLCRRDPERNSRGCYRAVRRLDVSGAQVPGAHQCPFALPIQTCDRLSAAQASMLKDRHHDQTIVWGLDRIVRALQMERVNALCVRTLYRALPALHLSGHGQLKKDLGF